MMPFTVITAPADYPLTLEEAKEHLRLVDSHTADDAYILGLIDAVTELAQNTMWRALVRQTLRVRLDKFPGSAELIRPPRPPLIGVNKIDYVDTLGAAQTMPAADYIVDTDSTPGRIALAPDKSWPGTQSRVNAVTLEIVAGFGDRPDVPQMIRQGMLLAIGNWYENRESVAVGAAASEVPQTTHWIFDNWAIREY